MIRRSLNEASFKGELDVHAWRDEWAESMRARFNDGDPTMAANGEAAWDQQVEEAAGDLYDQIEAAKVSVEEKLLNGGYFRERGANRTRVRSRY